MTIEDRSEAPVSAHGEWQEPTIGDAFVDGLRGELRRDRNYIRLVILPMVALIALAFVLPSIRSSGRNPTWIIVVAIVDAYQVYSVASLQRRLGRPTSRAVAAALGVLVAAAIVLVPFALISWNLGPSVAEAPLTAVIEFVINSIGALPFVFLFFGAFVALAFVADRRYLRARRLQLAEETKAAIAQERAARARSRVGGGVAVAIRATGSILPPP